MDFVAHNYGEMIAQLYHVYREEATTNTAFKESNDYYTFGLNSFDEIKARVEKIIAERENAYTKRTGQKVQAKSPKSRELMLEVNADTTAEDIMNTFGEYFKQTLGTEILAVAVHKDEGYLVGKEPPHRRLTSGVGFELDQETGKYYFLKSDGKNYNRDKELDISKYEARFNYHAHIIFSNLRADGSSITSKSNNFKPFNKFYWQEFHKIWTKIYNDKLPHKQPLEKSDEPKTSFLEPMLQIIADKIIQGTRNKQKLNDSLGQQLEQYLKDNENPIKRIKSIKPFLERLNQLAYTNEALNKRDYATFLSQMRESGCAVLLQQILLQKLSQMSEQELKTQDDSALSKFFGIAVNLFKPAVNFFKSVEIDKQDPPKEPLKELELAKKEIKELKAENEELKKQNQEQKAENKELKESLENARQEINSIIQLFKDLPELLDTARFKTKNFLAVLKNRIKAKIKKADNGSEVAQISTKGNLDDKSYTKEQKTLKNDNTQEMLAKITQTYESEPQEKEKNKPIRRR